MKQRRYNQTSGHRRDTLGTLTRVRSIHYTIIDSLIFARFKDPDVIPKPVNDVILQPSGIKIFGNILSVLLFFFRTAAEKKDISPALPNTSLLPVLYLIVIPGIPTRTFHYILIHVIHNCSYQVELLFTGKHAFRSRRYSHNPTKMHQVFFKWF